MRPPDPSRSPQLARLGALVLVIFMATSWACADAKGTYKTSVKLRETVSSGKVEYKLDLKAKSEATLEIRRTARVLVNRDSIDRYGDHVALLASSDKLSLTGSWSEDGGDIRLLFDRLASGEVRERCDIEIELAKDGDKYLVEYWTPDFFGQTEKPRFFRSRQGNGDALVAGLAVLAAGALIVSSQHGSSGTELSFETGGNGEVRLGDGDRSRLDRLSVDLRKDQNGTIKMTGSWPIEIKGTWRHSSSGYLFQVTEAVLAGSRRTASGSLWLSRDRGRDRIGAVRGDFRVDDRNWRSANVDFYSARG